MPIVPDMESVDLNLPAVQLTPRRVFAWLRTETGRKWLLYGTVSGIAILTSWLSFALAHNILGWTIVAAQVFSVIVSTVPAFFLSRSWVWAKDGKVSFQKEVLPFWILSLIQFFISVGVIKLAEKWINSTFDDRATRTVVVQIINLVLYGAMWFGKFFFLNNLLFRAERSAETATPSSLI